MNLNKVFIIGNLTRDPELKTLPSGTMVASFGVATNRIWKDNSGQRQEDTQFHNIVVFGRQAEVAGQYLKKGSSVFVEGRLQTRSWNAADGTKRNRTEVVVERMQLGPRKWSEKSSAGKESNLEKTEETLETIEYPEEDINPEEIPF
ncbi:MAG: single-stranded DNA-binding protein [Patescibacteria group bacterium]